MVRSLFCNQVIGGSNPLLGSTSRRFIMGKVKCLSCGVVLESKYRHDFQTCDCENGTFVDGGNDYTRIGGADLKLIEVVPAEAKPTTGGGPGL